MSSIAPNQFAKMPHRQKQEVLDQWPAEKGGEVLDQLYGHEYEPFIHDLIRRYCKSRYLDAGGEPEAIVEAGRAGRLYGMERIATYPFNFYTSGSAGTVQEGIVLLAKAEYLYVSSDLARQRWEAEQEQELRHPSLSLDDVFARPDGERVYPDEIIPDATQSADPEAAMRVNEAWWSALSRLTEHQRELILEVLSGKDLGTIARERGQKYVTVQVAYWRARKDLREELKLSLGQEPGLDRNAAMDDGYHRLLEKIVGDLPP